MSICKYCGKPIENEPVMNPDENGNGYHHYCLVDMEFKTRDKQIYDKGRADALKWIPVSERLPEKEGQYLAYIVSPNDAGVQYMMTCDYFPSTSTWCPDDEMASRHVVAWMPLPEPYKENVE